MYKIIAKCDCCKKEIIVEKPTYYPYAPTGWREIQLSYYAENSGEKYLCCDECLPKYGLTSKANQQRSDKTTADKLLELIQEIVYENSHNM